MTTRILYKAGRFRCEIANLIITFSPITIITVVAVPLKVVISYGMCNERRPFGEDRDEKPERKHVQTNDNAIGKLGTKFSRYLIRQHFRSSIAKFFIAQMTQNSHLLK